MTKRNHLFGWLCGAPRGLFLRLVCDPPPQHLGSNHVLPTPVAALSDCRCASGPCASISSAGPQLCPPPASVQRMNSTRRAAGLRPASPSPVGGSSSARRDKAPSARRKGAGARATGTGVYLDDAQDDLELMFEKGVKLRKPLPGKQRKPTPRADRKPKPKLVPLKEVTRASSRGRGQ